MKGAVQAQESPSKRRIQRKNIWLQRKRKRRQRN
jgi:hypothetical protein